MVAALIAGGGTAPQRKALTNAHRSKRLGQSTEAVDNLVEKMMKRSYAPCPMRPRLRLMLFSPIEKILINQ
jgi:hypothetical protein